MLINSEIKVHRDLQKGLPFFKSSVSLVEENASWAELNLEIHAGLISMELLFNMRMCFSIWLTEDNLIQQAYSIFVLTNVVLRIYYLLELHRTFNSLETCKKIGK